MVQIINPTPVPSSSSLIGQSIAMGLTKTLQDQQQKQQQSQLANLLFGDQGDQYSGIPQDQLLKYAQMQQNSALQQQKMQQAEQQEASKLQMKEMQDLQKVEEKVAPLQAAMGTVQRMRDISSNGRLGRGSSVVGFFGGDTAKDIGEYEQLGKSLISLATNIPIRNRMEFETLAEKLYDSSLPDREREGVLDAMERIINNSMSQYVGPQNINKFAPPQPSSESRGNRPPLESFLRK